MWSHNLILVVLLLGAGVLACGGDETSGAAGSGGEAGSGAGGGGGSDAGLGPWSCDAGEVPLDDGDCLPAGVPEDGCGQGFVHDGDAGCEPVLPAEPCGPGTMAIMGETTCRAVAPCGAGTWGSIPTETDTQHVDGSYGGNDSNGSASQPWTTIQEGIDAAAAHGIVAVAAGSYHENLVIAGKAVRLWGKCPSEVEIARDPQQGAGIDVEAGATGTEIRDLAITGNGTLGGPGVWVENAADVLVDRLWIHDLDGTGVFLEPDGESTGVVIRRSLIEGAAVGGVACFNGTLELHESVVRDTQPNSEGLNGMGVVIQDDNGGEPWPVLTVVRSLIERNRYAGVAAVGADVTIEDSLIRETAVRATDGLGGNGVVLWDSAAGLAKATLTGTVLQDNHELAVYAAGADLVVERTVVRDTHASPTSVYGMALGSFLGSEPLGPRPSLEVRSSLFERGVYAGVSVAGVAASLEGVIVRDIAPTAETGTAGVGVAVETHSAPVVRGTAAILGSVIERTTTDGIVVLGADVTIASTLVRDVASQPFGGISGIGIEARVLDGSNERSVIEVRDSLVERTVRAGIYVTSSDATIDSCLIRQVEPMPSGESGHGIHVVRPQDSDLLASATIRRSVVKDAHEVGIAVIAASGELQDTVVRGTRAQPESGYFGDGILASSTVYWPSGEVDLSEVTVTGCLIEASARAGLSSFSASITVRSSLLDCNPIDMNGELLFEAPFNYVDGGGNRCGCGLDERLCQAMSAGLAPPTVQ